MQFRQTQFDPFNKAALREHEPQIDFTEMEQQLAKEMARMRIIEE